MTEHSCHIMTPPLPLILIYRNFIDIIDGTYPLNNTNLLGLLRSSTDKTIFYDKEGKVWTSLISSDRYKPTLINMVLANTFYNPEIMVTRSWEKVREYELQELKDRIFQCIDNDDDILTQFVEDDKLKANVNNCKDFDSIVQTLLKYVFRPDEEQILKEFT